MARKEGWKEDGAMLGPEAEKEEGETAEGEAGVARGVGGAPSWASNYEQAPRPNLN